MLQSSPNSPGVSLHQIHGLLPPSAIPKTSGNAPLCHATDWSSPKSVHNQYHNLILFCKKTTTPALYLQPPTTPNVFGKQSTYSYTAILLTATHHFSWHFTRRQLRFFFSQAKYPNAVFLSPATLLHHLRIHALLPLLPLISQLPLLLRNPPSTTH